MDTPQASGIVARKSKPNSPTEASWRLENLSKNFLKVVNDGELGRAKSFIFFHFFLLFSGLEAARREGIIKKIAE